VLREGAAYVFLMAVCQLVYHVVAGLVPLATEHISFTEALSAGEETDDVGDEAKQSVPPKS
jgi:hypothetical protein